MTAVEQHETGAADTYRVIDTSTVEWVPEINLKGFLRRLLHEDPETGSSTHMLGRAFHERQAGPAYPPYRARAFADP